MRKRTTGVVAVVTAAVAMFAAPASAAGAAPPCEVMLDPETCETYYYGTLQRVDEVTLLVRYASEDVTETALHYADWAIDTVSCPIWGCP